MKWTGVFLLYATAVAVIAPVQAEGGVILETSPSSNHDPTTDACWLSSDCNAVLTNFSACYEQSGPMNPLTEQAAIYKSCVCNSGGGYREIALTPLTSDALFPFPNCLLCMQQAGMDIWNPRLPSLQLRSSIITLCHSSSSSSSSSKNTTTSLFLTMLHALLSWLDATKPPNGLGLPPQLSALASYAVAGTTTTTTMTTTAKKTTGETGAAQRQSFLTVPSQYWSQIPHHWPYTRYAVGRGSGPTTTSLALTERSSNDDDHPVTVGWIYQSLVYNPRPVFTPRTLRGGTTGLYQPFLPSWTLSFMQTSAPVPAAVITPVASTRPEETQKLLVGDTGVPGSSVGLGGQATPQRAGDAGVTSVATPPSPSAGEAQELSRLWNQVQSLRSKLEPH